MRRIDRRRFIEGLGASALALPLMPSLAQAQSTFPKRFIVFFHPNGVTPEHWFPTPGATERDFTLSRILAPLQPYRDKLVAMRGVHMQAPDEGPGEPHQQGMGSVLVGRKLQEGTFVGGDGTLAGWGDGISVDQEIANEIGGTTPYASLQLGVRATGADVANRLSYSAPARPLPPQNSPLAVFDQLFAMLDLEPSEAERRRSYKRSVLDAVRGQFASVRRKVSTEDRRKLDDHLEHVRAIERRLERDAPMVSTCQVPASPVEVDAIHEDTMPYVSRLQIDLLTAAFACDLTRVASLQYSNGPNQIRFPFLGSFGNDHRLSHAGPSDAVSIEEWTARHIWYAEQLAYLLGKLDAIAEGPGTMLDNTVVLWCSEIAVGNTHSHRDMPFLLAGSCGGAIDTGRYVQFADKQHCDLHLAIMQAMDVRRTTFGDPDFCSGVLPGILT